MPNATYTYYKDGEYFNIPSAPFYVLSTDTFMSGWGPCEDKTNICIVPCSDLITAKRIVAYVKTRKEQNKIQIVKGNYVFEKNPKVLYSLVSDWVNEANAQFLKE